MDNYHSYISFDDPTGTPHQECRPSICGNCSSLSPRSVVQRKQQQGQESQHDQKQQAVLAARSSGYPGNPSPQQSCTCNSPKEHTCHPSGESYVPSQSAPSMCVDVNHTSSHRPALAWGTNRHMEQKTTNADFEGYKPPFPQQAFPECSSWSDMADSGLGPTSSSDRVGKMGDIEFSQFERDLTEDFLLDTFGRSGSNFENTSSDHVVESLPVPDDAMTDWVPRISMTTDANLSCDVQIVKPVSHFNQSICAELHSSQKKTCIVLAVDMLRSILVRPTSCLCSVGSGHTPPSNPDAQMSGHVLTRNRNIERSLSRMLDCACSQSSQLQLIILAVFYRLISWYRAFISGNIVSGSHPSTNTRHEGYFADERVVQEPVTIGGYRLEATLAERIRRQILLDELLKLQILLERLSTRFGESDTFERGYGPSVFDSGHISKKGAGFQEENFGRLTECLSRQMRALKTDLGAVG